MKLPVPTPTQTRILRAMAAGAVIYTLSGLIHRAWIDTETFDERSGRLMSRMFRFTVPQPTLAIIHRNGWLINTTDPKGRWRGSTYKISRKGRAVLQRLQEGPPA